MRLVSLVVALAACTSPQEQVLPPDLEEAFQRSTTDTLRVLVLPERADPLALIQPLDRLAPTTFRRRYDHLPIAIADVTRDQALELEADDGIRLAVDRPLVGTGRGHGPSNDQPSFVGVAETLGADVTGRTGEGIVVAVVDSGVRRRHPAFENNILIDSADFVDSDGDGEGDHPRAAKRDPYGHGTMVAGVIAGTDPDALGVAPDVRLISARVLDDNGAGSTSSAVAALDWIIETQSDNDTRIVHLSVGAAPHSSFTTDPLAMAAEAALDAGLIVVAAAGNYGYSDEQVVFGGIVSPATHPGVITVGATDGGGTATRSDDTVSVFSSRGPTAFDGLGKPDLVAPGTHLALTASAGSTLWVGETDSHIRGGGLQGTYALASGTSFAAPAVTGVIAQMLEAAPDLTATGVKAGLQLTAQDMGDTTFLGSGAGQVNALGAVRLAEYWQDLADGIDDAPLPLDEDTLQGETVVWSNHLLWDGFIATDADLTWINDNGVDGVGDLDGTGILWDGYAAFRLRYIGLFIHGRSLANNVDLAFADDIWGNGILWDGFQSSIRSGRVWSSPFTWNTGFVWPSQIDDAAPVNPLFDDPELTGLTEPVLGDPDPSPPEPDFAGIAND